MVIIGSVALETVIGVDEAAVMAGAVGAGAIKAIGVDDADGSDAAWPRRRVSTCAFRPPWCRPRSQQSCTMVALYVVSKSSAHSRSDGDDMVQYGRSGREGSGAREGLGGGDREIELRRRTRSTSRSELWLALANSGLHLVVVLLSARLRVALLLHVSTRGMLANQPPSCCTPPALH